MFRKTLALFVDFQPYQIIETKIRMRMFYLLVSLLLLYNVLLSFYIVGWTNSTNCNEDIDECLVADTCANDGVCTNTDGSFSCNCTMYWSGDGMYHHCVSLCITVDI